MRFLTTAPRENSTGCLSICQVSLRIVVLQPVELDQLRVAREAQWLRPQLRVYQLAKLQQVRISDYAVRGPQRVIPQTAQAVLLMGRIRH